MHPERDDGRFFLQKRTINRAAVIVYAFKRVLKCCGFEVIKRLIRNSVSITYSLSLKNDTETTLQEGELLPIL